MNLSKQFAALLADVEAADIDDEEVLEQEIPKPPTKAELVTQERMRERLFKTGSAFKPTTRDEIVGIDGILGEIEELIHWLSHSKLYERHTSRLQPGAVFAGPPGTGKTLVSRWIATEAKALFINVRDFPHHGALFTDTDIHDLFRYARAAYVRTGKPVVLFWDEFENCAVDRNSGGATPEQRAVVSQITAELDGIDGKNAGILLIGCTNFLVSIDDALLRRGRMGVQIEFYAPDRAGKEKILAYYLDTMETQTDIDFNTLSYFFPKENTAADIEEACVEAWRLAVRRSIDHGGEPFLGQDDLVRVFVKQLVGPPTTFTVPEDERRLIAIHECGHAICALSFGVPLRLITTQPGKASLGRVMTDEPKEYVSSIPETVSYMKVGLGGIAAERTAGLDPITGSQGDIERVTQVAEFLVDHVGAGTRTGLLSPPALMRNKGYQVVQFSEELMLDSDHDIKELVQDVEIAAYAATERVGAQHMSEIARAVMEKVTMTGKQFRDLYVSVCGFEPEMLV